MNVMVKICICKKEKNNENKGILLRKYYQILYKNNWYIS